MKLITRRAHLPKDDLVTRPAGQIELVPLIYQHVGITPKPEWNPAPVT